MNPPAARWRALSSDEVAARLPQVPAWKVVIPGQSPSPVLFCRFSFPDFQATMAFVNRMAALAAAADHHPTFLVGYGSVEVTLSTHDVGGLSEKDFALAQQISGIV